MNTPESDNFELLDFEKKKTVNKHLIEVSDLIKGKEEESDSKKDSDEASKASFMNQEPTF